MTKAQKNKDMRLDIGNSITDCPRLKYTIGSDFKQWLLPGYFPYNSGTPVDVSYCMAYLSSFSMEKVAYKVQQT